MLAAGIRSFQGVTKTAADQLQTATDSYRPAADQLQTAADQLQPPTQQPLHAKRADNSIKIAKQNLHGRLQLRIDLVQPIHILSNTNYKSTYTYIVAS